MSQKCCNPGVTFVEWLSDSFTEEDATEDLPHKSIDPPQAAENRN